MRVSMFLMFLLASTASFGAYQYIVSGFPPENPSNSTCSAAVSVNAQTASGGILATSLETRYRTFAMSSANSGVFYRRSPGGVIIVR